MLAYQLMPAAYAIEDLRKRRLKVSFLDDMNDPFELLSPRLERAAHRIAFGKWREDINELTRVLCFSKSWSNPVLWSHYADKHRGICLGFEIPDNCALEVQYTSARLELQIEHELKKHGTIGTEIVNRLLTTKYVDWAYEQEVRMFVRPQDTYQELGLQFYPFDSHLQLRRVVVGARSSVALKEVEAAIQPQDQRVEVIPTRLAFQSYRVIKTPRKP